MIFIIKIESFMKLSQRIGLNMKWLNKGMHWMLFDTNVWLLRASRDKAVIIYRRHSQTNDTLLNSFDHKW
jgi:hypothetical protein